MTEREHNDAVREPPGPREVPPGMLEDVLLLTGLNEAAIRQIAGQLVRSVGTISPERIAEIVNQHLAGEEAEAVARIVANITPSEVPVLLRSLQEWSRQHCGDPQVPSDATIREISSNLNLLVQDYPALRLMHKAQRLVRDIGNELQSALFVCDLRPVYDDAHTEVVGFVPLVNMKIGYTKQNGEAEFFEAVLTGDELQYVLDRGGDALNKLRIVENMIYPPDADEIE